MTDQELGVRIQGGDERAFTDFCNRHRGWIFSKALGMLKNQQDAEEAVQDVFLKMWRFRQQWEPIRGNFRSWFYVICQNQLLDARRKQQRDLKNGVYTLMTETHAEIVERSASDPKAKDGLDVLLMQEQMEMIEAALCEMAYPHYRLAWILNKIEGYTHKQIAKILNMKLGTVKVSVWRTNCYLRDCLSKRSM